MTQEDIKKRVLETVKSDLDNFCHHISHWSYFSADEELNRIISQALDTAFKEWVEEMIKLSDEIEIKGNTAHEEWRAFKKFRNTMRDKLQELGE